MIADSKGFVLASGFNGSPAGLPHCTEVGCLIDGNHCVRTIHAELNAILLAARHGVPLVGSTAYITTRPCIRCLNALIQSGVSSIFYLQPYPSDDFKEASALAKIAGVHLAQRKKDGSDS